MFVMAMIGIPFVLLYTAGVYYFFRGKVVLDDAQLLTASAEPRRVGATREPGATLDPRGRHGPWAAPALPPCSDVGCRRLGLTAASHAALLGWILLLATSIDRVFDGGDGLEDLATPLAAMVALLVGRAACIWSAGLANDRAAGASAAQPPRRADAIAGLA